jgi:hypothetical protein
MFTIPIVDDNYLFCELVQFPRFPVHARTPLGLPENSNSPTVPGLHLVGEKFAKLPIAREWKYRKAPSDTSPKGY